MFRPIRKRPMPAWALASALVLMVSPGCDYGANKNLPRPSGRLERPDLGRTASKAVTKTQDPEQSAALLKGIIRLLETAALTPGGSNFTIAAEQLNQYFAGNSSPSDFQFTPTTRAFLKKEEMPDDVMQDLESNNFTVRDGRHIEDCLIYRTIAQRVAPAAGDDLTRARAVFDWVVSQVQLIPAGTLAPSPDIPQAQARPYDVLLRGMGTEQGFWSERGWVFMSLCRQLNLDVGLLSYTPRNRGEDPGLVSWVCGVIIGSDLYLFDQRLGRPIPGPNGQGVATFAQAMKDPSILGQLDLPGQMPYGTTVADLAGKVQVFIDSSLGLLTPRMRLLQTRLANRQRMVLYRDPAEQASAFARVLGPKLDRVGLWHLPYMVERSLFTEPQFVFATQQAILLFDPQFPLLAARLAQLRGDWEEAIPSYVQFRFAKDTTLRDKKTLVGPDVQRALDMYSTYFLGLCHLDKGDLANAKLMFGETLRLVPEPGNGRPTYHMYRFGAQANLARVLERLGDRAGAIREYGRPDPTESQWTGNQLAARALIWLDPMSDFPDPPAPAPPYQPLSTPAPPQPPAAVQPARPDGSS